MIRISRAIAFAAVVLGGACGSSPARDHYWNSAHCEVTSTGMLPLTPKYCEAYLRRTEGASVLVLHVDELDTGIANEYPSSGALRILLAPKQPEKSSALLSLRETKFPGQSFVLPGQAQLLLVSQASGDRWSSARGSLGVGRYQLNEHRVGDDELIDLDIEIDLSQAVVESSGAEPLDVPLTGTIRVRAADPLGGPSAAGGASGDFGGNGNGGNGGAVVNGAAGTDVGEAGALDPGGGMPGAAGGSTLCSVPCGAPGCSAHGACNGEKIYAPDTVALCESDDAVGILAGTGTLTKLTPPATVPTTVYDGPLVDQTSRCLLSGVDAYTATPNELAWAGEPPVALHGSFALFLGATATDGYYAAPNGLVLEVRRFVKPHEESEIVACAAASASVGTVSPSGTVYLAHGTNIVSYAANTPVTCAANTPETPFAATTSPARAMLFDTDRVVVADGPAGGGTFDVLSIDEATAKKTVLGSGLAFNVCPLAVKDGATFFVEATQQANGSSLVLEVAGGKTRALGVATGTVSALAATTTHVYWSLLQGGVFRAPR